MGFDHQKIFDFEGDLTDWFELKKVNWEMGKEKAEPLASAIDLIFKKGLYVL